MMRRLLESARVPRRRDYAEWCESEIWLPNGPYENQRFKLHRQPYVRLLFDAWQSGQWRRRCATGPTQSGKTLSCFAAPILYHLFEVSEDVICGVPTGDMVKDKWIKDLRPVIEASKYRDQLPTKGPGASGGTPSQIHFRNGRSLTFMTAGGGSKGRAGATSRVLVVTETDGFDEVGEVSREGDKFSQLEGRVRAFGLNYVLYMECTVTDEHGRTWQEYSRGTASRIICPCPHGDHWVSPEKEDLIGWQEAPDKVAAGEAARWSCPECGVLLTEDDRREMNLRARVIHRGQELTPDGEIVGDAIRTDTLGFRWSAFNNLFVPTEAIGQEEWTAAQDEVDPDNAQLVVGQQVWCIPGKVEEAERVDISIGVVRGSSRDYAGRCNGRDQGSVPTSTEHLTAFIDVHRRFLQWQVVAHFRGGGSHVVDYGAHETEQPDVVGEEMAIADALDELDVMLSERFDLSIGLVDSGNWNKVVYAFAKRSRGPWRPSMGDNRYSHPSKRTTDKKPSPNGDQWYFSRQAQHRIWVANFNSDWWKHRVHNAFLVRPLRDSGEPRSGAVTLFGDDPNEHTEFGKQICAERFERKFEQGKGYVQGWRVLTRDNHLLDCHVGNMVARSIAMGEGLKRTPPTAPEPPTNEAPKPPSGLQGPTFRMGQRPRLTPGRGNG